MFDPRAGFVDYFFGTSTRPGSPAIWTSWAAILVADAWKNVPFIAIILLAGLQVIPSEIYEAARDRRRQLVAVVPPADAAAAEAGADGRADLPPALGAARLRRHLHHDRRRARAQHRDAVVPQLADVPRRHRLRLRRRDLGDARRAVPRDGRHRRARHAHEGARHERRVGGTRGARRHARRARARGGALRRETVVREVAVLPRGASSSCCSRCSRSTGSCAPRCSRTPPSARASAAPTASSRRT